jgi:DNA-directed RNA polymerase subunit H (RpoH/RPB5)
MASLTTTTTTTTTTQSALASSASSGDDKEQSSSAITSIYKSRANILELLRRQNYNVADYVGVGMHEVHTMVKRDQLDMLVSTTGGDVPTTSAGNPSTSQRTAYIKYAVKKLNQKDLNNVIDDLFNLEQVLTKNDTLIIVTKHNVNDTIVQLLNQLWEQEGYFIIIFTLEQLQFNILDHQYVPMHEILSAEETKKIVLQYNITNYDQLPNISRYDPVAQAIGIRPGQICKITRSSKTSIISYYYRVCA